MRAAESQANKLDAKTQSTTRRLGRARSWRLAATSSCSPPTGKVKSCGEANLAPAECLWAEISVRGQRLSRRDAISSEDSEFAHRPAYNGPLAKKSQSQGA